MSEFVYKESSKSEFWRRKYRELADQLEKRLGGAWETGYEGGLADGLTQAKEKMTQSLNSIFREAYELGYEDGKNGFLRRWDDEALGVWRDYIYARYGPQLPEEEWDGENLEGI